MLPSLSTDSRRASPPIPSGRLLIINIGRLGDTILRNAVLDSAFRTFAEVDYVCGRHNFELLRHDSRLNRVTVFHKSPAGWLALAKVIVGRRYDAVIDLKCHPSSTSLILGTLLRARVKTGANRGWLRPFHRDSLSVVAPSRPVTDMMERLVRVAGWVEGECKPTVFVSADSRDWFQKNYAMLARPFAFVNISATTDKRTWPIDRWAKYLRACGLDKHPLLINGAPEDRARVLQLSRDLPGSIPFQPRSFMDVVAAVDAAHLVFSVDTGVVHVCSALDKPIVALFGTSNISMLYLPSSSWKLVIHPRNGRWVRDIQPEDAIDATRQHGLLEPFKAPAECVTESPAEPSSHSG